MRNALVGTELILNGMRFLDTVIGTPGHAIYGPYERLEAGSYKVVFQIEALDNVDLERGQIIGRVDIASNSGRNIHKTLDFSVEDISSGYLCLDFSAAEAGTFEYRIFTHGTARLRLLDRRPVVPLCEFEEMGAGVDGLVFPNPSQYVANDFFMNNIDIFGRFFDAGALIFVEDNCRVKITIGDVTIVSESQDDLRFLTDVLIMKEYNAIPCRDSIFIDIGLNIGLTTLFMAAKNNIKEVYSFEPFFSTFERAARNVDLNTKSKNKIKIFNYGIGGRDAILKVGIKDDSGANSVFESPSSSGTAVEIELRDAGSVMSPIFAAASAQGLGIVMKIDCEGSEFDIFESLQRQDLFRHVDALMVEWHSVAGALNQADLFKPLREVGFIIFDLTNVRGRKFFYAVRSAQP